MIGATRVARLQTRAYSFRENSDARYSAEFPLQLYSPSGAVDPAIAFVQPMLLDPVLIQRPEDTNPLDLFVGVKKIDYPTAPAGAYLRIEAHEAPLPHPHTLRPALLLVLALPAPTFVSRINLLGNLLLDPVHDGRGPRSNFGLPRHLDVYAVDGWPPDIAATVPHPRDWRRIYSSSDLRALWGWTPIDVHPTNCSHLVLVMRDLPPLFETTERIGHTAPGEPVTVHGLSIQRLAVWRYEYGIHDAREVSYAPAASWQGTYEAGISSTFWSWRGVNPPVPDEHQSIFSDFSGKSGPVDHLPSALVGLPSKHRHGSEFVSARGYSGEATSLDANGTDLIVQVTEEELPYVDAVELEEAHPRGSQNSAGAGDRRVLRIYHTDDPETAMATPRMPAAWTLVAEVELLFAFEPFGRRITLPHPVNARFFRLEVVFDKPRTPGARRFALTRLSLLRSRHRTLVAAKAERFRLEQIQIRLSGPSLLDDQAFVDGADIMDLVLESAVGGQPWTPVLSLRSMMDVRERTRAQLIPNARQTRASRQQFHERARQGESINDAEVASLGGGATTRAKQVYDPASLQHTVTVSKQRMVLNAATDTSLPSWLRTGQPAALLSNIEGITTDRNANLNDPLQLLASLQMIGDVLGIPNLSQLLSLPGLASHFNGKGSLGKLLGITDVTSLLSRVIQALNPFAMFGVGSGTSDSSAFFPSVPRIAIDDALDLHAVFKERFYGLGAANPLPDLPFRPSISLSGSFGGQFFGGGSIGLSQQLDAGKSTVQSKGSQGQVHDTLTYYRPDNVTWSDTEVVSSDVSRWTIREHLHERDEEYVWKGKEARYGGRPLDVVLATIPVGLILQPQAAPVPPDAFRIRVGHLPPDVTLDVTYMGTAHPIAPQALTAAFPGVGAPMLPTGGGPIAPGTPGDGSGSSSPAGEVDARDSDPRDGQ